MKILAIDGEAAIRRGVGAAVARGGHVVVLAGSGLEGLRALFVERPDLVILDLDLDLPGMDGPEVLARVRQLTSTPVLALSSQAGELEKVRALDAGADDYMTKPFGSQELLARVNALVRRVPAAREEVAAAYDDGMLRIDPARGEATALGSALGLTPLEMRMLWTFAAHPGEALSAPRLLSLVWGTVGRPADRVKVYVGYLRAKLTAAGLQDVIVTSRGFGYRFDPPGGDEAAPRP